jgi:hypothetical protein
LGRTSEGADGRSLDVEWFIISYSPILEYRVQYRNTKASHSIISLFLIDDSYLFETYTFFTMV